MRLFAGQKNLEEYKNYATYFGIDNLSRKRELDLQSLPDRIHQKPQTSRASNPDSRRDSEEQLFKSTQSNNFKFSRNDRKSQEKTDNKSVKYSVPQLYSTKAEMQRKLNIIDKTKVKNLKDISDLTPKSKAHVVEKVCNNISLCMENFF